MTYVVATYMRDIRSGHHHYIMVTNTATCASLLSLFPTIRSDSVFGTDRTQHKEHRFVKRLSARFSQWEVESRRSHLVPRGYSLVPLSVQAKPTARGKLTELIRLFAHCLKQKGFRHRNLPIFLSILRFSYGFGQTTTGLDFHSARTV